MIHPPIAPIAAVLAVLSANAPAPAQVAGTVLDAILVTGPQDDGAAQDNPAGSTTDRATLQGQYQGAGIATVLNGLAGVTTETVAGDPAIAVNIRGLQGNGRVVVTIDGARQNFARAGHGANGTFYADPEMLRSIEVVRGPSGAGAATGGIGGTLALRTITADDLIAEGGTQGGEGVLRYGTLAAKPTAHLAWATRLSDRGDALVAVTSTKAGDYHAGDGTLVHAENEGLSGLAKLSFAPDDAQRLSLSLSRLSSDYVDGWTSGILRQNRMTTGNVILDYGFGNSGDVWTADASLYRTATTVRQQRLDGNMQPTGQPRSYTTGTTGVRATVAGTLPLGQVDNDLTLVLDAFRDGVTTDDPGAAGGSLTPSGNRSVWSVLVQDRLALTGSTAATFGLRQDGYRLTSPDGSVDGNQVSPALTLSQEIGAVTLFATVARAYRPPTLSEALVNGQHPEPATFYIRPNPDLQPERALSQEIGATLTVTDVWSPGDRLTGQVSAYRNGVSDYIGLVRKGGLFNGYYQYDNIDRVRIEGVELAVSYDAGPVFGTLSGQITSGTDQRTGDAVSGVAPDRAVLTAGLRSGDGLTEYGARLTTVAGRDDGALTSRAWRTVDLFLTRQIKGIGEFGLALNNITDETYRTYLTTQPSPGFNISASLRVTF
jgi:hemoglobin/transferrin/lactoferrin receptor protein